MAPLLYDYYEDLVFIIFTISYSCSTTDGTCDGFVVLALKVSLINDYYNYYSLMLLFKILRSDHDFESKYRILLFIGTIVR